MNKINKKYFKSYAYAYTMAEMMVVFALILVATAFMVPALKNNMPDADKTSIKHVYAQVSQIIGMLIQSDAYPDQGLANHEWYGEVVFKNGYKISDTARSSDVLNSKITTETTKAKTTGKIDNISDKLRDERYNGNQKFAELFKTMVNIKEDNLESSIGTKNTVPICCSSVECNTGATKTVQNSSTTTCFKTNKGITFCLPKNTNIASCLKNYNPNQAEKYYIIVKIFLNEQYENQDGYYLKVYVNGKISILPTSMVTYSATLSDKCLNRDLTTTTAVSQVKGRPIQCNCDETYKLYNQCRIDDYLSRTKPTEQ